MAQPLIINVQESSCREIKETLRYKPNTVAAVLTALAKDPRAGEGVLLDKDDVTISLSQDMLLAHDGPFQYLLKQGFVRKLTAQERVNALVKRFGPELRQRLEALPKKAAKRSGPITGVPTGRDPTRTSVPLIGQHFPLHGFEAPVKQAFQLFCDMDYRHVRICDYDKPQLHPNILKFVAAPGMGKTTALGALGPELYNYMWKHKDVVTEVLETRGSLLHKRVFSSLQPSQPLVFTLDLKGDLDTLVREEQDLSSQEILALRMLLSTLRDNATAAQYRDLLEAVGQLMPKGDLQPLDVLLFVQAAMGLEGQHSMAIFAWDEVNAVKPSRDSETSWVQEALSAFVKLCVAAGQDRVTMMPVAIIASTLASATSLRQTASGQSIVCEVQLLPLSYRDMKSILVNVCRRAGQAWRDNDDDLDASVKQLLKFTYGIPRFLAWAIHSMSAGPGDLNDEKLRLVAKDQETCPWLLKLEVPLHAIMTRLVETARLRSGFSSWLENDGQAQVMAQILAHSVLERRVARTAYITPTITWQQAENSGMCSLLHTGTSIPTSSPTVSPTVSPNSSSGGGIGQASGSNQLQHSHLEELLTGVVRQRARADDASSKYVVFVSPLLVVAAMQGLGVDGEQLSVVPMVKHMVDFWRIREYSDLTTFILRLELARKVLGLQQMPLRHLLPREAQLPEGFQDLVIKVPEARAGKLYDRPKRRLTKDTKAEQCWRHINSSSGSSYAYIGGGSDPAPDSWLVLQTVGGKPLIIFVQSKKRQSGAGEVEPEGLDAEAEKCWGRRMKLKRLLVYVTDEPTNKVPKVYPSKAGLSVVVIGRAQHGSFYSHSVSLTKRCIEWDMENEKAKRAK